MTPDYGTAFGLWRDGSAAWPAYVDHAFVRGLGDGSLPQEAFLHYLRQDYVFLIHFSRAWALAVTKAGRLSEMQAAAGTVDALVNHEMALHVKTCEAVGISQAELEATTERPENMAYTRFVLEAGYSGDFLDLLAALAPCVLGYGVIGAALAQSKTSDTYAEWIGTYAGDDYQGACQSTGKLLDNALEARLGPDYANLPKWQQLTATFEKATVLEVGFWDMGLKP